MIANATPAQADATLVDVQVRFDDFRADGVVSLPHHITVTTDGKVVQEINLESFTSEECQTPAN